MAPSLIAEPQDRIAQLKATVAKIAPQNGGSTNRAPLKLTGVLDQYKHFDSTTVIGTEFPELQVADLLSAPNSDELIRELAVLVSRRGVVFFRDQQITLEQQKELGKRLGQLTGDPADSRLHVHPATWKGSENGDEITDISSTKFKEAREHYARARAQESEFASKGWHIDITFEQAPSSYAILKVHTVPKSGGDTLWASTTQAFAKLSTAYQKFLEGLTAYHTGENFKNLATALGKEIRTERGSSYNQGLELDAVHPVVRTNPVTGWKSIFLAGVFPKYINELKHKESEAVFNHLRLAIAENHDLQVRFRWEPNSLAIWDNRSTAHTATFDVIGDRAGDRVVKLGERPYLDPNSKVRDDLEDLLPQGF